MILFKTIRFACALAFAWLATMPAHGQHLIFRPDMTIDRAEATTGWTSGNALTTDAQIKVHGARSLKAAGGSQVRFRKLFTNPIDVSQFRYLTFWYYVDRPDLFATTGDRGQIEIASSNTDDQQEWFWNVEKLNLQRGWNFVRLELPGSVRNGPVDATRIRRIRIYHAATAAITVRIDHITFSNRDPSSFAFAEYLKQKRIAGSTAAVQQEDEMFALTARATPGSAERSRVCRFLAIDLSHREISSYSLEKLGVTRATLDNQLLQRRFIREYVCGERSMSRAEFTTALQNQGSFDVAVTSSVATQLGLTTEAAAETESRLLELDLARIFRSCGTVEVQVDRYIATGLLPSTPFPGPNILVPQCTGTPSQISIAIGRLTDSSTTDRKASYLQCMAPFKTFGSQCDNPYANPDDDFEDALKRNPNLSETGRQDARDQMQELLQDIRSITVQEAREAMGEASHADPNHPQFEQLENIHENLDRTTGQMERTQELIDHTQKFLTPPDGTDAVSGAGYTMRQMAILERLKAEFDQLAAEQDDFLRQICFVDSDDSSCPGYMANEPSPEESRQPRGPESQRCASMSGGPGQNFWFNKPASPSNPGFVNPFSPAARQVTEFDRIDHCLCQLFDRAYNLKLPGDFNLLSTNCPTPEERIAQKCLENPQDGVDGIRAECRHLMQPIAVDRDAQAAKWCKLIRPNCDGYLESDSDCGCGTVNPNGLMTIPGCRGGVPNCPNGIRVQDPFGTCGCEPFDSGINQCTPGGKDFYLTLDPANDLKVRIFPDKPGFSNKPLLVTKPGPVRFVTAGVTRAQLTGNGSTLTVNAGLVGNTVDKTGNIKVSCTNSNAAPADRNRLIQTIALSNLNSTGPTALQIVLDATERAICFGSNPDSKVYFEFFVEDVALQQVAFTDILGDLGNIKPPCVDFPPRPTPGQRPLSNWPALWTMSDGTRVAPRFNGTGPLPPIESPPIGEICMRDGIPVPCP